MNRDELRPPANRSVIPKDARLVAERSYLNRLDPANPYVRIVHTYETSNGCQFERIEDREWPGL